VHERAIDDGESILFAAEEGPARQIELNIRH
jgi:hypothetical protein